MQASTRFHICACLRPQAASRLENTGQKLDLNAGDMLMGLYMVPRAIANQHDFSFPNMQQCYTVWRLDVH